LGTQVGRIELQWSEGLQDLQLAPRDSRGEPLITGPKSSEHKPLTKQRHSSSIVSCYLFVSHSKNFTALSYIPNEKGKRPF